ncbi:hypothetical protein [Deinococcus hopiensis]|uniref:Uncharacterized protein n=1 Tax=Deinococcus hopiensis KR-140 TaxID=695939 RepID=A0A1W1ULL2_9DEIO|nr:hypothetical protein [Deinococcus hopiensis]SMB81996.1 hypothetical protein SAMN00790413_04806 [Deinococcus hopiensis KR-140]
MTAARSISEELEQASRKALQEREQIWRSHDDNEQVKHQLASFTSRFSHSEPGVPPVTLAGSAPNVELAAAVQQLATTSQELDRLGSEMTRTQAELAALATRAKQFWLWLIVTVAVLVAIAIYLAVR